jgi:hypothetical protein
MATTDPVLQALVDLVQATPTVARYSDAFQNALKVIREHTAPGGCNGPSQTEWCRDMSCAPRDRLLLATVDGQVRFIAWGKTSHVPMYGWCLADQGIEDYDLCTPAAWMYVPAACNATDCGGTNGG